MRIRYSILNSSKTMILEMCAILVPGKSIIILKFRSREKISKMKLIFNVEVDRIY